MLVMGSLINSSCFSHDVFAFRTSIHTGTKIHAVAGGYTIVDNVVHNILQFTSFDHYWCGEACRGGS